MPKTKKKNQTQSPDAEDELSLPPPPPPPSPSSHGSGSESGRHSRRRSGAPSPESVGRPDGRHTERPNAPPPESVRDAPSSDEGGPVHQGRKAWIISGSGWRHVVWPGTPNTKSLAAVWNEVVNLLQEQGMISLETAKQMEEWSRE